MEQMMQVVHPIRKLRTLIILAILIVVGFVGVVGCTHSNGTPQIVSLRDQWDLLQNRALDWQDDAYLTNVTYYLRDLSQQATLQLAAEFHSSHVPDNEMLLVAINSAGDIIAFPFDLAGEENNDSQETGVSVSVGSSNTKPILKSELYIDSQNALNFFSKIPQVESCLQVSSGIVIELSLNKIYTDTPAWELDILGCPDRNSYNAYYLDAITGEGFEPSFP